MGRFVSEYLGQCVSLHVSDEVCWINELFQRNATDLYVVIEEDGCVLAEDIDRFGSEETAIAALGTEAIHFWMACHVVGKAASHIVALHDDVDVRGSELAYLIVEDRIVGASKDDSVYFIVLAQLVVNMATNEIVRAFALGLSILYHRHPNGASLTT